MTLIDIIGLILLTAVIMGLSILSYQNFKDCNYGWSIGYAFSVAGMLYLLIDYTREEF